LFVPFSDTKKRAVEHTALFVVKQSKNIYLLSSTFPSLIFSTFSRMFLSVETLLLKLSISISRLKPISKSLVILK